MHRDLHPQEGALNLFFDKIKEKTLLKDFDQPIITKSRAQVERRGSDAITNQESDAGA